MARMVRLLVIAGVMAAAVAIYAGVAAGHDGGNHHGKGDRHGGKHRGNAVLEASLAPSEPGEASFHGVAPGGVHWVLHRGSVELKSKGRLELRVRGLVIPPPDGTGTAGGVTSISASLYCGADTDTAAADTSDTVPLSQNGNARIKDRSFNVPSTCLAPVILVHPNGDTTRYIAVTGWRTS